MYGLDLFSGVGGISIALAEWVRTIAYCESDRYAQGVLLSRMRSGEIDGAPIWDDVRTLKGEMLPKIDIIFGGFPCQDISNSGPGVGLDGQRSGLFFEIVRLVREIRPRFIFLENVPAISVRGLDRVLLELTALGYDCRWTIVSAAEVGAHQIRERWFLLANSSSKRLERLERKEIPRPSYAFSSDISISKISEMADCEFLRSSYGIPVPVDRVRCLGNSVVPAAVKAAFKRLCGLNE